MINKQNIKTLIVHNGFTIVIYINPINEYYACKINNYGKIIKNLSKKELDNYILSCAEL